MTEGRFLEVDVDALQARTDAGVPTIEGIVVPFGVAARVRDLDPRTLQPTGPWYRERIVGAQDFAPEDTVLEAYAHRGPVAGRGAYGELRPEGAFMRFRMLDTQAGRDLHTLAGEGLIRNLSIELEPTSPTRRLADGTVERTAVFRRVAAVERGAYQGAQITAARAAAVEDEPMADQPADVAATPAPAEPVDDLQARAAAETDAAAALGGRSAAPIRVTRAPLVYGPTSDRSFLRDVVLAAQGDPEAQEAQGRHYRMLQDVADGVVGARTFDAMGDVIRARAGDVLSSEIPGAYPNTYLPGLLVDRIAKGRPMGGFFDRVPISDARPQIFAKVTTSTSVAVQSAQNVNPAASDFATTAVTVTPLLYGAETVVSRQVIDGASPAAESMIIADMLEAFAQASEAVIVTAVEAGAAAGSAITLATPYSGVQGNVVAYYGNRFQACQGVFAPSAGFTTLLSENDTTGRPKMPWIGAINSDGVVQDGGASGAMLGANVILSYGSTTNVWTFARRSDYVIFESPIARFSYEASTGPAGVRMGVWGYLVVGTRLGGYKTTAA